MIADARTRIVEVLDGPDVYEIVMQNGNIGTQILADRLLELFSKLDEHYRCDFDCDNCHTGGCGNPACTRGLCPEENATHEF